MKDKLLCIIEVIDKNGQRQQYYYHGGLPREIDVAPDTQKIKLKWFEEI